MQLFVVTTQYRTGAGVLPPYSAINSAFGATQLFGSGRWVGPPRVVRTRVVLGDTTYATAVLAFDDPPAGGRPHNPRDLENVIGPRLRRALDERSSWVGWESPRVVRYFDSINGADLGWWSSGAASRTRTRDEYPSVASREAPENPLGPDANALHPADTAASVADALAEDVLDGAGQLAGVEEPEDLDRAERGLENLPVLPDRVLAQVRAAFRRHDAHAPADDAGARWERRRWHAIPGAGQETEDLLDVAEAQPRARAEAPNAIQLRPLVLLGEHRRPCVEVPEPFLQEQVRLQELHHHPQLDEAVGDGGAGHADHLPARAAADAGKELRCE